jgi:hypothetical protein
MSDDEKKYPAFGLYFRRYAPFDSFGGASPFNPGGRSEGDQRKSASVSLKDTSRTYGCVMFNRFGIIGQFAGTSGTKTHTLLFGDVVGYAKVDFTVARSTLNGPDLFGFRALTSAPYPLWFKRLTPDIDTFVDVQVDFGASNFLRISGQVFGDNFPNLEVFLLCYRSKNTALLVDGQTTGGRDTGPFTRLYGTNSGHVLARFAEMLALNERGELLSSYKTARAITLPDYPPPLPSHWNLPAHWH